LSAYIARRILEAGVVLFGASLLVFVVLRVVPGDPIVMMYGTEVDPRVVAAERQRLGLDRPILVQYEIFLEHIVTGDLGESLRYRRSAAQVVAEALPATVQLAAAAMGWAFILGVPAGIFAACTRGGLWDRIVMVLSLVGQCTPTFWLGILFMLLFAVILHWLPTSGSGTIKHLILPSLTLGLYMVALLARLTRSCMLEVLGQDYLRTARAKGLAEWVVVTRHGFRNALIPIVTVVGLQTGALLGGAIVTEAVFAWPGIGNLAVQATNTRDYNLVQAVTLLSAVVFVVINLAIDVLYTYLDPTVGYS